MSPQIKDWMRSPVKSLYCLMLLIFSSLCPAESLSLRKLSAVQDEPYGDIYISPGKDYEEVLQTLGSVS